MRVIDVGAAPGGWSQIIADKVDSQDGKETVVAADLLQMVPIAGVKMVQGNISEEKTQELISENLDFHKADLVCSDAVPDFMGDRFVDHMRATQLNREIIQFCSIALKPGGNLLMKIIQGPAEKELSEFAGLYFNNMQKVKPSASRNESAETYYLCQGFEQSQDETALRAKRIREQLEQAGDDVQQQAEVLKDFEDEQMRFLQEVIEHAHKNGLDIPEKLKAQMQTSHVGRQLNLDNKLSAREKAKAKKKFDEEAEEEFFQRTGIRNTAEDYKLENMINKYEYDMEKFKLEDRKKLRLQRQQYFKNLNNIDPETGRPRPGAPDFEEEDPGSSDLDNEYEQLSRENPQFDNKEF